MQQRQRIALSGHSEWRTHSLQGDTMNSCSKMNCYMHATHHVMLLLLWFVLIFRSEMNKRSRGRLVTQRVSETHITHSDEQNNALVRRRSFWNELQCKRSVRFLVPVNSKEEKINKKIEIYSFMVLSADSKFFDLNLQLEFNSNAIYLRMICFWPIANIRSKIFGVDFKNFDTWLL